MSKTMFAVSLVFFCASFALAQHDYHKFEVSGGYSIMYANGIIGDGDLFSDKTDDPLTANQSVALLFPANSQSTVFFAPTPLSYSGKRHRARLQGFNGSATYNFSKYLGAKFEMSGNYRSNEVVG